MVFISNDFPPIEKVGFKERVLIVRAVGQGMDRVLLKKKVKSFFFFKLKLTIS